MKILIYDADIAWNTRLQNWLGRCPAFQMDACKDSEDFLNYLERPYDVILFDINDDVPGGQHALHCLKMQKVINFHAFDQSLLLLITEHDIAVYKPDIDYLDIPVVVNKTELESREHLYRLIAQLKGVDMSTLEFWLSSALSNVLPFRQWKP